MRYIFGLLLFTGVAHAECVGIYCDPMTIAAIEAIQALKQIDNKVLEGFLRDSQDRTRLMEDAYVGSGSVFGGVRERPQTTRDILLDNAEYYSRQNQINVNRLKSLRGY